MSERPFYRIDRTAISRLKVDRSEFIGEAFPVDGTAGIEPILQQTRKRYPDARHQPYAYRIAGTSEPVEYCSDDGEPTGTAGRPILDRLRTMELIDVLLIVSRYFGGKKLGTRRLREAFSESGRLTLDGVNRIEVCRVRSVRVSFPFDMTGTVNAIIQKTGGMIERQEFDECVRMDLLFRIGIAESAVRRLAETIQDRGQIDLDEDERLVDA